MLTRDKKNTGIFSLKYGQKQSITLKAHRLFCILEVILSIVYEYRYIYHRACGSYVVCMQRLVTGAWETLVVPFFTNCLRPHFIPNIAFWLLILIWIKDMFIIYVLESIYWFFTALNPISPYYIRNIIRNLSHTLSSRVIDFRANVFSIFTKAMLVIQWIIKDSRERNTHASLVLIFVFVYVRVSILLYFIEIINIIIRRC